jgi:hypothetical protein
MTAFPNIAFDFTAVYTALGPIPSSGSVGVGKQAPKLGQVYYDVELNKLYKFVYNAHTTAFSVGDVCSYDISGGLNTTVKKVATADLNLLAGVWMGAVATLGYGWIQVRGYNATINVEGTTDIVIGDSLKGSNGQFYAVHDAAVGTVAAYPNAHIIALAGFTTNSTGTIAGDIRCG